MLKMTENWGWVSTEIHRYGPNPPGEARWPLGLTLLIPGKLPLHVAAWGTIEGRGRSFRGVTRLSVDLKTMRS
jgi:hypothetical protein